VRRVGPVSVDPVGDGLSGESRVDLLGESFGADENPPAETTPLGRTLTAAALSTAAAAWMAGGIFRSGAARGVGVVGIAIAVLLTVIGARVRRPTTLQLLTVPLAVVAGALLVLPSTGGSATIPSLVRDALHAGGILQPPVAFDPGWRLLLVVLFAGICSAATSLALSADRPMLGVALPAPVIAIAALVQPQGSELLSVGGSVVLLAAALLAAYGADLSRASSLSLDFERGRVVRAGALALALVVAVAGLGHVGALFPQPERTAVIPPQPPQAQPPGPDRVLFAVRFTGGASLPLRTGVLDVYDTNSHTWLLPPYDTHRLESVRAPSPLPGAPKAGAGVHAEVTIRDLGGHVLPSLPDATRIAGIDQSLLADPRTGELSLADQPAGAGTAYSVDATALPTAQQLTAAPPPSGTARDFLAVPPPPQPIAQLLLTAPANPFNRMQFLRQKLYAKVVAAGGGTPVAVSPQRVAEMLGGAKASPFEIVAAEALLARWSGVPSRIGFGYEPQTAGDAQYEVHPRDGSAWLEVWFQGYGWLPVTGAPPHAQATFDRSQRNTDPTISPSDRLGLLVYVPVRVHTSLQLYEEVQWWLLRILPAVVLIALLALAYPALLKRLRRARRWRWALQRGPAERIAVAYAEFRDAMRDLAVGDPSLTPLLFLAEIDADDEHAELAWLVTRALWGDLRRDLQNDDAEAAELLAHSVRRRVTRAQSMLNRGLGAIARTSLRTPYTAEIPNLWPQPRRAVARAAAWWPGGGGGNGGGPRRLLTRRLAGATAATLLLAVTATVLSRLDGGTQTASAHGTEAARGTTATLASSTRADDHALDGLVPAAAGTLVMLRETSVEGAFRRPGADALVSSGRVYTIHNGDVIEGSVQVSTLRPDVPRDSPELLSGLEHDLGGTFVPMRERVPLFDGSCACSGQYRDLLVQDEALRFNQRIEVSVLPDQRIYLWFPPQQHTLMIVVLRSQFPPLSADELVLTLSDQQHGAPLVAVPVPPESKQ
jgi:Transglutaminase-like superfamily/TgpA N-terminal domain